MKRSYVHSSSAAVLPSREGEPIFGRVSRESSTRASAEWRISRELERFPFNNSKIEASAARTGGGEKTNPIEQMRRIERTGRKQRVSFHLAFARLLEVPPFLPAFIY